MEQYLLEGYSLKHLSDSSTRDKLLSYLFLIHHRKGANSQLAWQFRVRFDTLMGLILEAGVRSEAVFTLYQELRQEFQFYRYFDDILAELDLILGPLPSI